VGCAGLVLPRSGNALHHGLTVANAPGLIDAAYRGEVKVILLNTDPSEPFHVRRGDRIAQLVIQRVEQVEWHEVDELDGLDRGGGFGHSGRQ
jgi:dUTP pyrophosphatase